MGTPKGQRFGGRQKGTPNKGTAELKKAAQKYDKQALQTLATIMQTGENENARISAANALLDRGHGKPAQAITGEGGTGPMVTKVVHEYLS